MPLRCARNLRRRRGDGTEEEAVAGAFNADDGGVVEEPVEECGGHDGEQPADTEKAEPQRF